MLSLSFSLEMGFFIYCGNNNMMVAVDHLVNNAGINSVCMFEDTTDITLFRTLMVIHTHFWRMGVRMREEDQARFGVAMSDVD